MDQKSKTNYSKKMTNQKKQKKGRLIIRNLSFGATLNKLSEIFSKFGTVTEISIPKKEDGKMRGFAFIQYQNTKSAILAINALNSKEILGRPVAIDFAFPKAKFEAACSESNVHDDTQKIFKKKEKKSINEDSNSEIHLDSEKKIKVNKNSPCSFDSQNAVKKRSGISDCSSEGESSDTSDASESSHEMMDTEDNVMKKHPKMQQNDTNEGRTVFVRNVSFDTSPESLKELMSKFGPIKYCLLCVDKVTEHPKGTAFVQFNSKEDAEKCIQHDKALDDTFFLDGRKLSVTLALSKEEIQNKLQTSQKKDKDNRNLYLLSEGLIRPGSDAAEGVSQTDLMKRLRLESMKRKRLKNYHNFVSETRLCVHNLPLGLDDKKLRKIFLKAAGPKAVINEVRIMRDMKHIKTGGKGKSKGFGFINFSSHEHAIQALRHLNNNPNVFTPQKRPIVEFSVENMAALKAKERRFKKPKEKSGKEVNEVYSMKQSQKCKEQVVKKQRNSKKQCSRTKQQKKKISPELSPNKKHVENRLNSKMHCNISKQQQNKGKKKQKAHILNDSSFTKLVHKYKQVLHSATE